MIVAGVASKRAVMTCVIVAIWRVDRVNEVYHHIVVASVKLAAVIGIRVIFAGLRAGRAYASVSEARVITESVKLVIAGSALDRVIVDLANLLIVVNLVYLVVSGRAGAAVAGAAGKRQFAELMIVLRAWGAGIE